MFIKCLFVCSATEFETETWVLRIRGFGGFTEVSGPSPPTRSLGCVKDPKHNSLAPPPHVAL